MKRTEQKKSDGISAIYVRRSVSDRYKGNNSLSIASQKEECVRYLDGKDYRIYCDDGMSAGDTEHRPSFCRMMADARSGEISRIIVKKYDRFSRNMRDYLNITDELDSYGVSVYSISEPFNTRTKEGRMMRNNLLSFAEFERETIAARVADAYSTKAHETGFFLGGKVYLGYDVKRRTVNGKTGSVLVPNEKAAVVRKAYELYSDPQMSLGGIISYCRENGLDMSVPRRDGSRSNMNRSHLSKMLETPLYVRADADVYGYLASRGFELIDDISAYDGIHGLFMHGRSGGSENIYIKVGYHEGIVDSSVWLAVQDKKAHNSRIPNNGTAVNSWLTGLIKCAHCGYALSLCYVRNASRTKMWRYFADSGALSYKGCVKTRISAKVDDIENEVYEAMKQRVSAIRNASRQNIPDSGSEEMIARIFSIDVEIQKLMNRLADSDDVLFGYIRSRINELHSEKTALGARLRSHERMTKALDGSPIFNPLDHWDELSMREKHAVAVSMIEVIRFSDETGLDITFRV